MTAGAGLERAVERLSAWLDAVGHDCVVSNGPLQEPKLHARDVVLVLHALRLAASLGYETATQTGDGAGTVPPDRSGSPFSSAASPAVASYTGREREVWLEGYEYALRNLGDEGVRNDAARLGYETGGGAQTGDGERDSGLRSGAGPAAVASPDESEYEDPRRGRCGLPANTLMHDYLNPDRHDFVPPSAEAATPHAEGELGSHDEWHAEWCPVHGRRNLDGDGTRPCPEHGDHYHHPEAETCSAGNAAALPRYLTCTLPAGHPEWIPHPTNGFSYNHVNGTHDVWWNDDRPPLGVSRDEWLNGRPPAPAPAQGVDRG